MKNGKNIIKAVVFLLIGALFMVLASYTLRPADDVFFRRRFIGLYAEKKNSLDVVALGSSAIYRYLDNPYLYAQEGITSYTWGTPSQPFYVMRPLIRELEKTQTPKLVILEVRKFTEASGQEMEENRFRMVTDNMKYSANRTEIINKHVDGWDKKLTYYFDIIMYHSNWEKLSKKYIACVFNERRHSLRGWTNNKKNVALEAPAKKDAEAKTPIPADAEEELLAIIKECKEADIELLFVATPWLLSDTEQGRNNYIRQIVEQNGYRFLDCNLLADELDMDYEVDFYNGRHTNSIGARKFTAFLGKYIKENYDFEPEHDEATKQSWEKTVEKDQKIYERCEEKIRKTVAKRRQGE